MEQRKLLVHCEALTIMYEDADPRYLRFDSHIIDSQVNLVLDDATEYTPDPCNKSKFIKTELQSEILLNGNQIAALVPGGTGPSQESISSSS